MRFLGTRPRDRPPAIATLTQSTPASDHRKPTSSSVSTHPRPVRDLCDVDLNVRNREQKWSKSRRRRSALWRNRAAGLAIAVQVLRRSRTGEWRFAGIAVAALHRAPAASRMTTLPAYAPCRQREKRAVISVWEVHVGGHLARCSRAYHRHPPLPTVLATSGTTASRPIPA